MLFVQVCILSGVIYAGLRTMIKRQSQAQKAWLVPQERPAPNGFSPTPGTGSLEPDESLLASYYRLSWICLSLSMLGALFYMPLSLATVPLTVYGAIPLFEQTWASIFKESRPNLSLAQSIAIVGLLATRNFGTAALIIWIHYTIRLTAYRIRHFRELLSLGIKENYLEFMAQMSGAKPHSVWIVAQGMEMELPFDQLRVGEIMVVKKGEVVPVVGTVVSGTAKISLFLVNGKALQVTTRVGDRVAPSTMVLSGTMHLRVDRL